MLHNTIVLMIQVFYISSVFKDHTDHCVWNLLILKSFINCLIAKVLITSLSGSLITVVSRLLLLSKK